MNEIKELLASWKNDGVANIGALELAHQAIELLVNKVEELENKINLQLEE
jgi:hypothetical protein